MALTTSMLIGFLIGKDKLRFVADSRKDKVTEGLQTKHVQKHAKKAL